MKNIVFLMTLICLLELSHKSLSYNFLGSSQKSSRSCLDSTKKDSKWPLKRKAFIDARQLVESHPLYLSRDKIRQQLTIYAQEATSFFYRYQIQSENLVQVLSSENLPKLLSKNELDFIKNYLNLQKVLPHFLKIHLITPFHQLLLSLQNQPSSQWSEESLVSLYTSLSIIYSIDAYADFFFTAKHKDHRQKAPPLSQDTLSQIFIKLPEGAKNEAFLQDIYRIHPVASAILHLFELKQQNHSQLLFTLAKQYFKTESSPLFFQNSNYWNSKEVAPKGLTPIYFEDATNYELSIALLELGQVPIAIRIGFAFIHDIKERASGLTDHDFYHLYLTNKFLSQNQVTLPRLKKNIRRLRKAFAKLPKKRKEAYEYYLHLLIREIHIAPLKSDLISYENSFINASSKWTNGDYSLDKALADHPFKRGQPLPPNHSNHRFLLFLQDCIKFLK